MCAHSPWSGRWQRVGAWGKCQCPDYGVPWAVPLVHSSSACCWHQFKPQFQPQDVAEITENASQFPRIWWKRGAVGWLDCRDNFPKPPHHQQRTETQAVLEVPQCMAGLCEAFQQADAETCLKKPQKSCSYAVVKCSVDVAFNWPQKASWLPVHSPLLHWGFSDTLISGVSTAH